MPEDNTFFAEHALHHVIEPLPRDQIIAALLRDTGDDLPVLAPLCPTGLDDHSDRTMQPMIATDVTTDNVGRLVLVVDWPTGTYPA